MGRPTKEFQQFDSLLGKLLTVPKSTIHERHAEHKAKSAADPNRRGPKKKRKKPTPPSGDRAAGGAKHTS
jgi:hypothetical protein